jgi:hypothetical protein
MPNPYDPNSMIQPHPSPRNAPDPSGLLDPQMLGQLGQLGQLSQLAGGLGNLKLGPNAAAFQATMIEHLCQRLSTCDPNSPMMGLCSLGGQVLGNAGGGAAPTCSAATSCLGMIDGLSCDATADPSDLLGIYAQVHSCLEALSC